MKPCAVKLITCKKHLRLVWHPAGQPCPACHPELYPWAERTQLDGAQSLAPDEEFFIPVEAARWPTKN